MFFTTRLIFVTASILSLGNACASLTHHVPFTEADYLPYLEAGTGVITGEALVMLKGGEVRKGAEDMVFLIPATPYTKEWFSQRVVGEKIIEGGDPRALRATRSTTTDRLGRFTFTNLPPGDYFLTCEITWDVPSINVRSLEVKRGIRSVLAYGRASVGDGETVRVQVTRPEQ
jgi:hypothetical protein